MPRLPRILGLLRVLVLGRAGVVIRRRSPEGLFQVVSLWIWGVLFMLWRIGLWCPYLERDAVLGFIFTEVFSGVFICLNHLLLAYLSFYSSLLFNGSYFYLHFAFNWPSYCQASFTFLTGSASNFIPFQCLRFSTCKIKFIISSIQSCSGLLQSRSIYRKMLNLL